MTIKIGDVVKNKYHGLERFGVVVETFKKTGWAHRDWLFLKVDWINDKVYEESIAWRKNLTNTDYLLSEYRIDQVQKVDVERTIETLEKCKSIANKICNEIQIDLKEDIKKSI